MSYQRRVLSSVGPTFIGPVVPAYADTGDTWCDSSATPNILKVFNISSVWITLGSYPGTGAVTTISDDKRTKRNIWTFLQDATPLIADTFEGSLWYAPTGGVAQMYNGTAWVAFVLTDI